MRKTQSLSKSRLYQKEEEIMKETKLLKKLQDLPSDLIRNIYNYMCGKAKLICNYKFEYLEKIINRFGLYDKLTIIEKLSKKQLLDLVYKGVLQKYPDIIETVDKYCYCLETEEHINVNGIILFNLWEKNSLINNFDNVSNEEHESIDWSIKFNTKHAIAYYIKSVVKLYSSNKSKTLLQKNVILNGNTLFLNLDKVFYLYKCLENLIKLK
jgi:hypothetical protein